MKKKNFVLLIVLMLCVVFVVCIALIVCGIKETDKQNVQINMFTLSEYQWAIDEFPTELKVGNIKSAEYAIQQARDIWRLLFRYSYEGEVNVSYDAENECWYICGILPPHTLGGVPHVIFDSVGNVLAAWHDM